MNLRSKLRNLIILEICFDREKKVEIRREVEFCLDWKEDAARRDFSINSIYSDGEGNLFDPYNGKKDLEDGYINFIGDAESRIKEDYLRILRYVRFFNNKLEEDNFEKNFSHYYDFDGNSQLVGGLLDDAFDEIIERYNLEKIKNKSNIHFKTKKLM